MEVLFRDLEGIFLKQMDFWGLCRAERYVAGSGFITDKQTNNQPTNKDHYEQQEQ
jgi:hypothetical protein